MEFYKFPPCLRWGLARCQILDRLCYSFELRPKSILNCGSFKKKLDTTWDIGSYRFGATRSYVRWRRGNRMNPLLPDGEQDLEAMDEMCLDTAERIRTACGDRTAIIAAIDRFLDFGDAGDYSPAVLWDYFATSSPTVPEVAGCDPDAEDRVIRIFPLAPTPGMAMANHYQQTGHGTNKTCDAISTFETRNGVYRGFPLLALRAGTRSLAARVTTSCGTLRGAAGRLRLRGGRGAVPRIRGSSLRTRRLCYPPRTPECAWQCGRGTSDRG